MNPYRGSEDGTTDFAQAMRTTYKEKISGPILDRIDLWLEVPHVDYATLVSETHNSGQTEDARVLILNARKTQRKRLGNRGIGSNAEMSARDIEETITLSQDIKDILKQSSEKLNLSPRSYHRLLKVSQTIADLDNSTEIKPEHVFEALQYRVKL